MCNITTKKQSLKDINKCSRHAAATENENRDNYNPTKQ